MIKKLIILMILLSMNLISCGLSQDVLDETASNYKIALETLCTEYGLDDAEVVVESDFSTKSDDGTYSLLFSTRIQSDGNSYYYDSEYIMGKNLNI